jgi:hypothetical protein
MPPVGDADGKAFSPFELRSAPIAVHLFPIWAKEISAKLGTISNLARPWGIAMTGH